MKPLALESSMAAANRSVTPSDRLLAIQLAKQTETARPPASGGCGRLLGKPQWHGDAKYNQLWGPAMNAYQPLSSMHPLQKRQGFVS